MGRKRKTENQHKKAGNFRGDRHSVSQLPVHLPNAPTDLSAAGKKIWRRVRSLLLAANLVAEIDQVVVRLLVESLENYARATDDVAAKGITIIEEGAQGQTKVVMNPAVRVQQAAHKEIVTICKQLGMTPAARVGLLVGGDDKGEADPEGVLGH